MTDKDELRRDRRPLAQGRGAAHRDGACASSSTPARRRRARSCSSSRPAPTRELYEEELRALGLPTYRATGRDYFGQQQVVDLLAYLRLLHNRYDDEALARRARLAVRRRLERRARAAAAGRAAAAALRRAREGRCREGVVGARRAALPGVPPALRPARGARADARRSSGSASRSSSSTTTTSPCSRSGTAAAATRTCASSRGWRAPTRSCAGPTSRASSASSPSRTRSGANELEAVAEEEGADAVRLLTIHCGEGARVQGRRRRRRGPRPRRGPTRTRSSASRTGGFGFQVADPDDRQAPDDGRVRRACKAAEQDAEEAERRRLYYVAMTRAIDRLIVSGAIGRARGGRGHADRLGARAARGRASSRTPRPARSRSSAAARACSCGSTAYAPEPEVAPRAGGASSSSSCSPSGERRRRAGRRPQLRAARAEVPAPPLAPRAAALLQRARAVRALLVPLLRRAGRRHAPGRRRRDASPARPGLAATEIGDAVHALLERVDLRAPAVPDDLAELVRARYPAVTDEELERIRGFVASYCESELAARIAALEGATAELPFAFEHDGVLLHGRIDVLHRERAEGARARLQDELARRGHAGGDRRARLPPAAARLRARLLPGRGGGGRGRLPLPRAARRGRERHLPGRRPAGARGRAVRGDRADPGERVPADARRVRLRATAPRSTSSARARSCGADGTQLRPRGAPARRPEARADPADHRAAAGRAPGRDDRAHASATTSSCSSR